MRKHWHIDVGQPTLTISIDTTRVWVEVGTNVACTISAGMTYLQSSQPRISSVEECKQLCQYADGCQSITYFQNSKWCSHFSTPCTNIKWSKNTVSYRLSKRSELLETVRPRVPIGRFESLMLLLEESSMNAWAVIFLFCAFDY